MITLSTYIHVNLASLSILLTHSSTTERVESLIFPLPAAEEGDHTQMSIGGVFVLLL